MSLQFIIGGSGSGKSYYAYHQLVEEAIRKPENQFYVIVPEQFTMQTQKTLVDTHPGGGILNIDVLSFQRLAYRVFEEVGGDTRRVLEDTGKSMVLRRLTQANQEKLPYLGKLLGKPGCLDEMKSLFSEFMQYGVGSEELEEMRRQEPMDSLLGRKLADISFLYQAFAGFLEENYVTAEEVLGVLRQVLPLSRRLAGSTMVFDGFTGFTPVQLAVLSDLMGLCKKIRVTVTMDPKENLAGKGKLHQLFYLSHRMIYEVSGLTRDLEEPVLLGEGGKAGETKNPAGHGRFAAAPALCFLEQNLFRRRKHVFPGKPREIEAFWAGTPYEEMEEVARRIHRLVREGCCRYGEIAVICGNLEEYASPACESLAMAGIPFFVDKKRTVLTDPFVEYIRAALETVTGGFSYEGVFRYLKSGMSSLTREEADRLENYCLATGVRGHNAFQKTWIRIPHGFDPASLPALNALRERLAGELEGLAQGFSGKKRTVREGCVCLYEFLVQNRCQEKLKAMEETYKSQGRRDLEKEAAQIYGLVMGLLEKLAEILGEERVTLVEFTQLLETGFSKLKIGLIPPGLDQVLVGDLERSRLKDVKALFLVGVNEGNIPKSVRGGGFLSDLDRDAFEKQGIRLAPGPKERINISRFYLYLNMTKPSRLLCLSYSLGSSAGEALRPSYLMEMLRELFPVLAVKSLDPEMPVSGGEKKEAADSKGEETSLWVEFPRDSLSLVRRGLALGREALAQPLFLESMAWCRKDPFYSGEVDRFLGAAFLACPSDYLGREVARLLYGEVSAYAATRLERYHSCPFLHFAQYGLRLQERIRFEFRPLDLGNVAHMALERFAARIREEGLSWANLEEEKRDALVEECVDTVCADYGNGILRRDARTAYMADRIKRILKASVWALQDQLRAGTFVPEDFELAFEGGRIDRVDIVRIAEGEDGIVRILVKVLDYKTGATSFDLQKVYEGLQLQLMLYLDGASQVEAANHTGAQVEPAGVFYFRIQDPVVDASASDTAQEILNRYRKEFSLTGLAREESDILDRLDRSLISLPVARNKDGTLRKGSSVADAPQFALLKAYVRRKMRRSVAQILEGKALISPCKLKDQVSCTPCPYGSVCGFEGKLPGYAFRNLPSRSRDQIWEEIRKEMEEPGEDGNSMDRGAE